MLVGIIAVQGVEMRKSTPCAAARAIWARVAAVVDVALAATAVTATVFVMYKKGCFHCRRLLGEACRRREPGLDDRFVNMVLAAHCTDFTEARTERGKESACHTGIRNSF
ncbi:hypothetical protein [Streptomyces werraensis]|uniref:hypothetical protein n=1 Tax=Streptomyces werraensis TaxID=68284 RepID=UPI001CE339BE